LIIARPSDVAVAFWEKLVSGELIGLFGHTMFQFSVSYLFAVVLGLVGGYCLWRYKLLGEAYDPIIGAIYGSPVILLYPISLVLFGRSSLAIIVMSSLYGFIPVLLNTRAGFLNVHPILLKVGRSMNLQPRQMFWKILVPAATPTIFAGLKLGLIYSLIVVVAMDFIVSINGLGKLISDAYFKFQIDVMFAAIVAVSLLAICFLLVLRRVERLRITSRDEYLGQY